MFERFTERARQVIVSARHEASRLRHDYVGTEHLLSKVGVTLPNEFPSIGEITASATRRGTPGDDASSEFTVVRIFRR